MSDPRYSNSYNELIATFCVRSFQHLMPMVLEVLEKMQTDTYEERGISLSHGPVDLFKFICQVFEGYNYCQQEDVCNALLSLCFK